MKTSDARTQQFFSGVFKAVAGLGVALGVSGFWRWTIVVYLGLGAITRFCESLSD